MKNQDNELAQVLSSLGNQSIGNKKGCDTNFEDYTDLATSSSHIKTYELSPKTHRTLKVCGQGGYEYQTVPAIRLQGKWLEKLGFEIGREMEVRCEEGKLVISLMHEV